MKIVRLKLDHLLKLMRRRLTHTAYSVLALAVAPAILAQSCDDRSATASDAHERESVESETLPPVEATADESVVDNPDTVAARPPAGSNEEEAFKIDVVGARFEITDANGRVLPQSELVGSTLNASDALGQKIRFRVGSVRQDPSDHENEIYLYELTVFDSQTGSWRNICEPGPDGFSSAFPVEGVAEDLASSGPYTLTCTNGSIGKCVRLGYKPWKQKDGRSLRDYHEACVRMLRADYCGDGTGNTRNGTLINLYDKIGIQEPDPEPSAFEAAWGKDGAVCVRKTRIAELLDLTELVASCPSKLEGKTGPMCGEEKAMQSPDALLFNKS